MRTIGPVLFVGFLNTFREKHPGVEVTVVENVSARLSELLLSGALDVALWHTNGLMNGCGRPRSTASALVSPFPRVTRSSSATHCT